jgi:predicted outer membrane repeat protein
LSLWCAAQLARADIDVRVGAGAGCLFNTIQAAVNAAIPANGITNILIARNQTYTAQQIDIDGKNVRLIGGYADCQQTQRDGTHTILSGAGGSARSIVNVRGTTGTVAFYTLTLQDGDELLDNASYGGAVDVTAGPHALIYFEDVLFSNNQAGQGGALSVRNGNPANQNHVFVWVGPNTVVAENHARYAGGGIYCRDATVHIKGPSITVLQNFAGESVGTPVSGSGGGIAINDCLLNVGSYHLSGSISLNEATGFGGGLYAYGSRSDANLYHIDPSLRMRVVGNIAGEFGGGIDIEQGAQVRAWDVVIEQNRAREGGGVALYDDGQGDNTLFLLHRYVLPETPQGDPATFDLARRCADPSVCNVLQDNIAQDSNGASTHGAALRVSVDDSGQSRAILVGGRMTRNSGRSLAKVQSFNSGAAIASMQLNGVLVDGNASSDDLIDANATGRLSIVSSTFASNNIGGDAVIHPHGRFCADGFGLFLNSSIVWQPGKLVQSDLTSTATGCLTHLVVGELGSIPEADRPLSRLGDPRFVNPTLGNFDLQSSSPALDFAPAVSGAVTYSGGPRTIDLSGVTNGFGPQDAGAYELAGLPTDELFANSFE